jgi:hypothetical protein
MRAAPRASESMTFKQSAVRSTAAACPTSFHAAVAGREPNERQGLNGQLLTFVREIPLRARRPKSDKKAVYTGYVQQNPCGHLPEIFICCSFFFIWPPWR